MVSAFSFLEEVFLLGLEAGSHPRTGEQGRVCRGSPALTAAMDVPALES